MPRPRKDLPPERFTSTEMAVVSGLTIRNFGLLVDRELAPEPADPIPSTSGIRTWTTNGLAHGALIGAFHRLSGFELLLAAKLAGVFSKAR